MKYKEIIAIIAATLFVLGLIVERSATKDSLGGSNITAYTIYSVPTNGSTTVGVSSTLIVATSTSRQYLSISNDSATGVYLSIGQPAVLGKGIFIPANGRYEMKSDEVFSSAIYGISSASSNVAFIESK